MNYVPRRAKVVDVLAVRYVKQGTETTRFRTGSTLHSCQCSYASLLIYIERTINSGESLLLVLNRDCLRKTTPL